MEAQYILAGIDVNKKMLAVVVVNARDLELKFECRRFGTTVSELPHLSMVTGTCRKGSRDGIYGAVLETRVDGVGGTVPVASCTSAVQSWSPRAQN